jgi:hypothetical protein
MCDQRKCAKQMIASGWGDQLVTIRALLLNGGVSLALASVASAQSISPPAANSNPPPALAAPATVPASPPAPLQQPGVPPQRIRAMVRASGLDPIGPLARHGNLYVQRALDRDAVEYRVVIDPLTGRTLSVRPMRVAGPYAYGPAPYRPYPPPYRPAYGRYWGPPPDDFGYGYGAPQPPRNVPMARLSPPQSQLPPPSPSHPEPQQQARPLPPSATASPPPTAPAPLPRPKPYVMEATGSIPLDSPKPLAPQKTPEPEVPPEPPAAAPQNNGAVALPPVAPLD